MWDFLSLWKLAPKWSRNVAENENVFYVHTHVSMHVCTQVGKHVCQYACTYIWTHVNTNRLMNNIYVHTFRHRYVWTCGHMYGRTDMNMRNMDRWNIDYKFFDLKGTVTYSFFFIKRLLLVLEMITYFFEKSMSYSIMIFLLCYIDNFRHWYLLIAWFITNCPLKGSCELSKSVWCLTIQQRNDR